MYDPVTYQRISPLPMGEFWVSKARGQWVRVDNKVAASAAHLEGKRYVTSEAYTSPPESSDWTQHPFTLKTLGDQAFCAGVNKFNPVYLDAADVLEFAIYVKLELVGVCFAVYQLGFED